MSDLILILVIGGIAGVLSGMFGIGGGAIIVPALILFGDFSQVAANGTSLAALLLPVGVLACLSYYRAGKLNLTIALIVAAGLAAGTWFGASLALDLPATTLRQAYGLFLLYMAWRYATPRQWWREWRSAQVVAEPEPVPVELASLRVRGISLAVGFTAGIFSGLFGIGGGVVIVPALVALLSFDLKLATGTSLGALLPPVGLPGVVRYAQDDQVDFGVAIPIALMLLFGALFGARLALGLPVRTVRRLYGLFLLAIGLRFLLGG